MLASREPAFARVVEQHGIPEPRNSEPGRPHLAAHHRRPAGQRRRRALDVVQARGRLRLPARSQPAACCHATRRCGPPECRARRPATSAAWRELVTIGRTRPRQPARRRRGSDRAADKDQGDRPLVRGNLSAVCRRAARHLPRRRPRRHGRDRSAHGSRQNSRAKRSCASSRNLGGRTAARRRCSPGTATTAACFSSASPRVAAARRLRGKCAVPGRAGTGPFSRSSCRGRGDSWPTSVPRGAPTIERVECDQRNEDLAFGDCQNLHILARRNDLAAQGHALKRGDRVDALTLSVRLGEESADVLLLRWPGVEYARFHQDVACGRISGVE